MNRGVPKNEHKKISVKWKLATNKLVYNEMAVKMGSIIDNRNNTMLDSLRDALKYADKVDISVGYFYFSGFNALAEDLKDKKIRILVGKAIDPEAINDLCRNIKKDPSENLDAYVVRGFSGKNNSQRKNYYLDSFVQLYNKSSLSDEFDSTESQNVFKMFFNKIKDGTLEIKMSAEPDHGKFYVISNKDGQRGVLKEKGSVFMGSSNFTYNGLLGQGEINEHLESEKKYDEYSTLFESYWNDAGSIDICVNNGNNEFTKQLEEKLWIFAKPLPYQIYVRILYELFSSLDEGQVKGPAEITNGQFLNLKYQIDAIKYGIDCLEKNNGVIIADVVGLGKSIIASSIAYNVGYKTVIISPPHLMDQWNDYQFDFGLPGVHIYSSGKIEDAFAQHSQDKDPILFIIDEAHRYRNELSESYVWLHKLTRSNPNNKVVLLTATPYNNEPKDLFALIKLFQIPNRSTLNSVDNLGVRFHELIAKYYKIRKEGKKKVTRDIRLELDNLSSQLRILIDPVIVRRSRIDLMSIKEYKEDLDLQHISFPKVVGPELISYDLGEIKDLYIKSLILLIDNFKAVRYNPAAYLKNPEDFNKQYGIYFGEMDVRLFLGNLAKFIRRLLVMRFESSKAAFKESLKNLLSSYQQVKKWWDQGFVPINRKGDLPDPDDEEVDDYVLDINNIGDVANTEEAKKKIIIIKKELVKNEYIHDLENDLNVLNTLYNDWFAGDEIGFDPKYDEVKKRIQNCLQENKNRKITIFSTFSDTSNYVYNKLINDGFKALLYTGSSNSKDRKVVKENFDASYPEAQKKNDYDIIVATDALSEGFNLNRAGVIFNYDIPYNPTRVVQRIGRLNRINKKVFDNIYIYNLFPTDIGEQLTLIKGISTLKMLLINSIVGNDTATLTKDENLESYFQKQYHNAEGESESKSWDVEYRNDYDLIKHNKDFINEILHLPERSRIVRKNQKDECSVSFAKRGNNILFAQACIGESKAKLLPVSEVLRYFKSTPDEKSYPYDNETDLKFEIIRNEIKKPYDKVKIDNPKGKVIDILEALRSVCPQERDYLTDLLEIIRNYDDLSDGELKFIRHFKLNDKNISSVIKQIKEKIPTYYIIKIKEKAEKIDSQSDIIMFTEDLRK